MKLLKDSYDKITFTNVDYIPESIAMMKMMMDSAEGGKKERLKSQIVNLEKSLKDTESYEISFDLSVITTSQQAVITDLSMTESVEGRVKLTGYVLKNFVSNLVIDGTDYDPQMLCKMANISDPDTLSILLDIGKHALNAFAIGEDTEKK